MAYDTTRALLDELMGKSRNDLPDSTKKRDYIFSDPEICKYYLCGFCPNELFTNTKSDLGPCNKVHDELCKQEFQTSKDRDRYNYERDWIRHLQRLIDDLDRRIRRGHDRLDHQDDRQPLAILNSETATRVEEITQRIQLMLKQIEDFGEEGRVDEAQQLAKLVDQLKNEKEALLLSGEARSVISQEKRMKVCEICGAFLVVGDTEKRIQSHMEGKQHQGYALIRKTLDDHKKIVREDDSSRRGRDNNRYHSGNRDRPRDRSRERDYRGRDRRERERDRSRSRSRERERERDRRREREEEPPYAPPPPGEPDRNPKRQR